MTRVSALLPAPKLTAEDCTPAKQAGRQTMMLLVKEKIPLAPIVAKGTAYWRTKNQQDFDTALTDVDRVIDHYVSTEAGLGSAKASFRETFGDDYSTDLRSLYKDRNALLKARSTVWYFKASDSLSGAGQSIAGSAAGKWVSSKWATLFPSKQAAQQEAQASEQELQQELAVDKADDVQQVSRYERDFRQCGEVNRAKSSQELPSIGSSRSSSALLPPLSPSSAQQVVQPSQGRMAQLGGWARNKFGTSPVQV